MERRAENSGNVVYIFGNSRADTLASRSEVLAELAYCRRAGSQTGAVKQALTR